MPGTNMIMVMFFLITGTLIYGMVSENNRQAMVKVNDRGAATTFLLYAEQADKFLSTQRALTGNITTQIQFPSWLTKNKDIRIYADNGRGFVYMPAQSNVYQFLMSLTENSSMIGLSNSQHIITNIGPVPKPPVIPAYCIVYII